MNKQTTNDDILKYLKMYLVDNGWQELQQKGRKKGIVQYEKNELRIFLPEIAGTNMQDNLLQGAIDLISRTSSIEKGQVVRDVLSYRDMPEVLIYCDGDGCHIKHYT